MPGYIHFLYLLLISIVFTTCVNDTQRLLEAAKTGDLPAVQMLIATGIDLNAQDQKGQTALMLAILNGHLTVAKTLLYAHVNPNIVDHQGRSPLMIAATLHRTNMIQLLIKKGAKIQAEDHDGDTALDYANLSELRDATYMQTVNLLRSSSVDSIVTHQLLH